MKLLYITEDRYPPFRADVVELSVTLTFKATPDIGDKNLGPFVNGDFVSVVVGFVSE